MKRTAIALTLIMAFLILAVGMPSINFAMAIDAGDILTASPHAILIESPNNYTIYKDALTLNFTVTFLEEDGPIFWQYLASLSYTIDDKPSVTILNKDVWDSPVQFSNVTVSELSNGQHKIEVTAVFVGDIGNDFVPTYTLTSVPVYFAVDTLPPKITIQSVRNEMYYTTDVPLTFTVNEKVSRLNYSIDGEANVTISGNTTLSELSYGSHNLTIYATDVSGNSASETVYFTTEPFPTDLIITASGALLAVVAAGLLLYIWKRKRGQPT